MICEGRKRRRIACSGQNGDGKAGLWRKRHAIRYLTYLVALPLILGLIWNEKRSGWLLLILGTGAYSRRPAARLWDSTWGWMSCPTSSPMCIAAAGYRSTAC